MASKTDWRKASQQFQQAKRIAVSRDEVNSFKREAGEKLTEFLRKQQAYRETSEQKVKDVRFE